MYFAVLPHFPMHAIALKGAVNQMALCVDWTKLQGTIAKDVDT